MHLNQVTLPILYQVLTTAALSIDITHPDSLFQDHNTTSFRLPRPNLTHRYYVDCERLSDQALPGLNPSNCLTAAPVVCDALASLRPTTTLVERWIWLELYGCALGYFLPLAYRRRELELPSEEECNRDIYGAIIAQCAFDSRYNAGSINVESLPKGRDRPGQAMTEGYPRYALAPAEL